MFMITRFNIIIIVILPKLLYKLNKIPINNPADFIFAEIDQLILKLTWNCKGPPNS